MTFQSLSYFTFLPVALLTYYLLPPRARWALLLACSYFFYACWNASYALLLLFCTVAGYGCGLWLERAGRGRRAVLVAGLAAQLGVLFFFKYYDFFADTLESLFSWRAPRFGLLLPLGVSFYAFQSVGYLVDVYRGDVPAARHFGKYALFVSFFPQLVAGPIARCGRLLPQFDEAHRPDFCGMREGALLILTGLMKKLLIADRLAVLVGEVYGHIGDYGALAYVVATVCFAFQLYCDFAGYSDIAIGSARLFGYRLATNFDRPYLSRSIVAFWRRWHMSLSSFFRDYVYIPLGGSRVSAPRWALNIMVVFVLSGLWHGAAWTFALWGALNGLYLIAGRLTAPLRERALRRVPSGPRAAMGTLCAFALTTFAWSLFRADSLADWGLMFSRLFAGADVESFRRLLYIVNGRECLLMALLVAGLMALEATGDRARHSERLFALRLPLRWAALLSMLFLLILLGKYNESAPFLYFRF